MRTRATGGFTLVELLIVVGLVAVLASVTVPAIAAGLERYEVISASQQITSTIRAARLQAVGRNMILKVRFDFPEAGQYQVVDADDNPIGAVQLMGDDISFADFTDVEFTTSGRLNAVGAATVVVTNGNDTHNRTITVSTSGRVRLE